MNEVFHLNNYDTINDDTYGKLKYHMIDRAVQMTIHLFNEGFDTYPGLRAIVLEMQKQGYNTSNAFIDWLYSYDLDDHLTVEDLIDCARSC